jgi:hypothetical protein
MRREKTQISTIRNTKGAITTNTTEIQGIIRDYFENLYSKTYDGEKTASSTNVAGKSGYLPVEN